MRPTPHQLLQIVGIILLGCGSTAGKLQIYREDSPIEALLGNDVTLPCQFYGNEVSHLDLSIVSVRWTKRQSSNNTEQIVYFFDGKDITPDRPGSYVPKDRLLGQDASLHLPNIQFSDEGEYTCHLIVTPEKAISAVTLLVSAQPTCRVRDSRLEMYPHTERSVTCYVDGFHPNDVKIHWVRESKASNITYKLDSRTCTSVPVQNQDESYNVTSVLSVTPKSREEDGDVYSCVISHRSLKHRLTCNFTLSVKSPPVPSTPARTIGWTIFGMIVVLLILAVICYCCLKESPDVSEISKKELIHMEDNILKCHITGFRPNNLTIKLLSKKSGTELTEINHWSSKQPRNNIKKDKENQNDIEKIPLNRTQDLGELRLEADVTPYFFFFFFKCVCSIHITPDFPKHHGLELVLQILHLKLSITRGQILTVKAPPIMGQIRSNQEFYKVGDQMHLTCRIHSFNPKPIKVLWYKDTNIISSVEMEGTEDTGDRTGLYTVTGSVQHKVTEDDYGKIFWCKVKHQCNTLSTNTHVQWTLKKLVKPILDQIQTNQESYKPGDLLKLKCSIHSFYPQIMKVTWNKEDEEISAEIYEPEDDGSDVYCVLGCASYTVKEEDFGKTFTCNVQHEGRISSVRWKLEKRRL